MTVLTDSLPLPRLEGIERMNRNLFSLAHRTPSPYQPVPHAWYGSKLPELVELGRGGLASKCCEHGPVRAPRLNRKTLKKTVSHFFESSSSAVLILFFIHPPVQKRADISTPSPINDTWLVGNTFEFQRYPANL